MRLVFDIGNTNITAGIYSKKRWLHIWRWPTLTNQDVAYYSIQLSNLLVEKNLDPASFERVIGSSVVPALNHVFSEIAQQLTDLSISWLQLDSYRGPKLLIDRPEELGNDLLANCLAAYSLYGGDMIIVDFGTALTFTTLDEKGRVLGVSISPGLKTAIHALSSQTAQLPEVPLQIPASVIGKNTVQAIQSGVLNGYVGLVNHQLDSIRKELKRPMRSVATGGLSSILKPLQASFDFTNPDLTLEGLRLFGDQMEDV